MEGWKPLCERVLSAFIAHGTPQGRTVEDVENYYIIKSFLNFFRLYNELFCQCEILHIPPLSFTYCIHVLHVHNLHHVNVNIYRMDLNFRGTKLSRIENFRVFRVFIFADARPTILY